MTFNVSDFTVSATHPFFETRHQITDKDTVRRPWKPCPWWVVGSVSLLISSEVLLAPTNEGFWHFHLDLSAIGSTRGSNRERRSRADDLQGTKSVRHELEHEQNWSWWIAGRLRVANIQIAAVPGAFLICPHVPSTVCPPSLPESSPRL